MASSPFQITPDLTENVLEVIKGTKLEGKIDAAYALVEYGHLAAKAYGHLKKTADILRKAIILEGCDLRVSTLKMYGCRPGRMTL